MSFIEIVRRARGLLRDEGRISLRALMREFDLDDEAVEELVDELVEIQQVAARDGKAVTWVGPAAHGPAAARTATDAVREPATTPTLQARDAERRQLTVFFCDLVNSTKIASQMDVEDWRETLRRYQETVAVVVSRYDGHVAQYLGDGILIYFGYPQAHENDAERAVRVGLEVVTELANLSGHLEAEHGLQLAARIGIHRGPVVVGDVGSGERRERLALGGATNMAARLQDLAAPDSVVVSAEIRRLTQGLFVFEDLGTQTIKGLSKPVPAFRVLRPSGVRSRLDVAAAFGLTPLVGREQEIGLLLDRWDQVREEMGNVVFLSGEAGIGKSRLVQVFRERLRDIPHSWLELRCSPFAEDSALHPVLKLLQRALAFLHDDPPERKLAKLEAALARSGFDPAETVPLFAPLLGVPLGERYRAAMGTPEHQKRRTLETLQGWLLALAKLQPLVLVAEDLHWADPSTLELLGMIGGQIPTAGMLVLLSHRPHFDPPWAAHLHATSILLTRLTRQQVGLMLERITAGKALPEEVAWEIADKADGVPLYVEEITKAVLESGLLTERDDAYELDGPLPEFSIPATLQDSLMARLDRLSPAKGLAELCAVLGREFSYELLRAVSTDDEEALRDGLARLLAAELLYRRGQPPHASYVFKHALIQETAYQSLVKKRRQQFHQRIAQVLEESFPQTAQTQPERVAHHFVKGGLPERAIDYWQQAGQRAVVQYANVEALRHLNRGLACVALLPEGPERAQKELAQRTLLGIALIANKGYSAKDVEQNFDRARELCREIGETPQLFRVLSGLWLFYFSSARRDDAVEAAEQMFRFAKRSGDPALLVHGHYVMGATAFYQGDHPRAEEHLKESLSCYDPVAHRSHAVLFGRDPAALGQIHAGLSLWYAGRPDRALASMEWALALARDLSHPLTLAWALIMSGNLRNLRREPDEVHACADEAVALARDQGLPMCIGPGLVVQGDALCQLGHDAIELMEEGEAFHREAGSRVFLPYMLGVVGERYRRAGLLEKALQKLEEALVTVETSLDRFHEPELYRVKGEVLAALAPDEPDPAEACFRKAFSIAREQSSRSLELRAAMSLERLRQRQGRENEARQVLASIYQGFSEGFDTADLKDAKALLNRSGG